MLLFSCVTLAYEFFLSLFYSFFAAVRIAALRLIARQQQQHIEMKHKRITASSFHEQYNVVFYSF